MTDVLALPLAHLEIVVANNEDWVDSLVYLVSDTDPPAQLDLRGLTFEMQIRRRPQDPEVVLLASTAAGSLSIGAAPDVGYLIFFIPQATMQLLWPGEYVGDIRVSDEWYERVCLTIDLSIIEGITR
jgi:hypothetical protein